MVAWLISPMFETACRLVVFNPTYPLYHFFMHFTIGWVWHYLKEIGSQSVQNITERIDRAYKLFFRNQKHNVRSAPPSFKKIRKYKSYTLKTSGWKLLGGNVIRIANQKYRYFISRDIDGTIP